MMNRIYAFMSEGRMLTSSDYIGMGLQAPEGFTEHNARQYRFFVEDMFGNRGIWKVRRIVGSADITVNPLAVDDLRRALEERNGRRVMVNAGSYMSFTDAGDGHVRVDLLGPLGGILEVAVIADRDVGYFLELMDTDSRRYGMDGQ